EAGKHGKITIKRVYGDFSTSRISKKWSEDLCNLYAIHPVQKYAYTSGKNSTDTALIIGAMDILHSHLVEGFCIVSSDSDYTGLATRIFEEGMFVMGIGRRDTPKAFVKACEEFVFTEDLAPEGTKKPAKKIAKKPDHTKTTAAEIPVSGQKKSGIEPNPQDIDKAFDMAVNKDTGLADFGLLKKTLQQNDSTFDHRKYGFRLFHKFCASLKSYIVFEDEKKHKWLMKKTK
ncbi:MAG: NYN domain-containing protein, partial [Planctomycetaceae bacterium]|nr:NYN domain-containing protein [Planctomycetaceae bacterium]